MEPRKRAGVEIAAPSVVVVEMFCSFFVSLGPGSAASISVRVIPADSAGIGELLRITGTSELLVDDQDE